MWEEQQAPTCSGPSVGTLCCWCLLFCEARREEDRITFFSEASLSLFFWNLSVPRATERDFNDSYFIFHFPFLSFKHEQIHLHFRRKQGQFRKRRDFCTAESSNAFFTWNLYLSYTLWSDPILELSLFLKMEFNKINCWYGKEIQKIIRPLKLLASVAMCVFPKEPVLRAPFLPAFSWGPVPMWTHGRLVEADRVICSWNDSLRVRQIWGPRKRKPCLGEICWNFLTFLALQPRPVATLVSFLRLCSGFHSKLQRKIS